MRNKRVPVAVITGMYNQFQHSNTVITITDESERDIPVVNSDNFTVCQPIYSPKGVTNEWVLIEGTDIVNTYLEMFGNPHTAKYGPMATIAYNAVLGRFNLAVLNMRPAEATYPNMYLAFNIEKAKDEKGQTSLTKTLYACLDSTSEEYMFSFDKAEIEEWLGEEAAKTETINEIPLEYYNFGYLNYSVEGCKLDVDIDNYFNEESMKLEVPKSSAIDDVQVHVPQFFLAYRGAGQYGNIFRFEVSDMKERLNGTYPFFNGSIKDAAKEVYSFSFGMFDTSVGNLNYGFGDRATNACQKVMTATNAVQEFRAWSLGRKYANRAEKPIHQIVENTKAYLLEKIKEKYPSFNPEESVSNYAEFTDALDALKGMFTRNKKSDAGAGRETPFSFVNPFEKLTATDRLLINYIAAPRELRFDNGDMGELQNKLDELDFDWDTTLKHKVPNPDSGELEEQDYKVWEQMLIEAFNGTTDDALFDPTIVPDSIVFGEQYPVAVQETIDKLCHYKEDWVNNETCRPDFTYIRTPDNSVNTISKVLDWQAAFLNAEKKNLNMHPMVGSWRFTDQVTGAQERFSGWFDWIGEGSILFDYLFSYTSKSFASGDYSLITKGATNSQILVPRTSAEREELKTRDILYFKRRSTGLYALGEDTGYAIGKESVLKSLGSNIQFNRIMNIAHKILRDNVIIDPTTDELDRLKSKIESAIVNPAKHFKDKVSVVIGKSTHSMEIDRNVVLCEIRVTGNEYSRYNRLHMISQRPTETN